MTGKNLKELIDVLGISQRKLAEQMGVTPQTISAILTAKDVRTSTIERIASVTNMPISYFFKEEREHQNAVASGAPASENIGKSNGTPYYDLDAAACGSMAGFGQALTDSNNSGYISLPFLKTREGDMFIQTRGRSMIDAECPERSIPEGAIVLIRNWRERHIEWGEIYCLVTADGYVVKKLMPGDDDSHIKCVSADSINYPPFSVALSDIQGIARVVAVVSTTVL